MADVFGKESPFHNETSISVFIRSSKAHLGKEFDVDSSLRILQDNWVDTVHDIRLLTNEHELLSLRLPDVLVRWIELQCSKKFGDDDTKPAATLEFIFQAPLDHNGIFYHLATSGGKKWTNPATLKLVTVTCSTIMADSKPANAILALESVRCVTKPIENSWFQVELLKHRVKPNYYMLRHYSTWDTEALRAWRFEASNDGRTWKILREHINDTGLNAKGAAYAWPIQNCGEFYSQFRIRQTGPNSNRHHYLSLSGFELYGSLQTNDVSRKKSVGAGKVFRYQFDFDTNGVLYYLGTRRGSQKWINPAVAGLAEVRHSSISNEAIGNAIVGRTATRCVSLPNQDSYFIIDLKGARVNPTHYTLRHYSSFDTEALRCWYFQGSNDGNLWVTLLTHKKDDGLKYRGATKTWTVPAQKDAFSMFRIFQYGLNSNQHWYLALSGFEVYGTLFDSDAGGGGAGGVVDDVDELAEAFNDNLNVQNIVHCRYNSDFDTEGVCFYLGSAGKTRPWQNPATAHVIDVSASSTMQDSVPLPAVVGRALVRCVTKPEKNSWMAIDFKGHSVRPTHYTLKHYESWDTEALRNWRLEGSNDGVRWTLLREHNNDTNLDKKGSSHTWDIPRVREFYSRFRLYLTDVNSNNHYYLACSGFEIYGALKIPGRAPSASGAGAAAATPQRNPFSAKHPTFRHSSDFDENGLCYYLGTKCGSQPWQNPGKLGYIEVSSSGIMADSVPLHSIVGRETIRCVTQPTQGAWVTIHFKNYFIRPNAYSLKHYSSWHTEALRNWALQGSNDNVTWVTLQDHQNDGSLNAKGATHTWQLPNSTKYFCYFRLAQTGVNSNNHLYMALSGFEIYGSVYQVHPDLQFDAANKSDSLAVEEKGACLRNAGSQDTWQSCRTIQSFDRANGELHHFDILVLNCPKSSNSWLFINGLVPPDFKCQGQKQWLGSQESWGYIAGTGGKCFNVGKSTAYGKKWGEAGCLVGCTCDYGKGTIEFFRNEVSQGVTFSNFRPKDDKAHPAVSLTAQGARVILVKKVETESGLEVPHLPHALPVPNVNRQWWDSKKLSTNVSLNNLEGTAFNRGSQDTWQIALSQHIFASGRCSFVIEIVNDVVTSNTWRFVIGLAPAKFNTETSCWVGSQDSWGYIAGTGGKAHRVGKSEPYGAKFGGKDKIGVVLDFPKKTIEFLKNGVSQGIAFYDLVGPVRAAISMTGTNAAARLSDING